jgi:hypothetical protein
VDLTRRLDIVLDCLLGRLEVLRLSRELDERTKASIDQRQREYLLREQLKSIQKELGEGDAGNSGEIEALRKAIAAASDARGGGDAGEQGTEATGAHVGYPVDRVLDGTRLSRLADRVALESARAGS